MSATVCLLRRATLPTLITLCALAHAPRAAAAQRAPDRVLVRSWDAGPEGPLAIDGGASGVWQRVQKLGTTASVLYTTGHPDDEEAGVLTFLSRGLGVRTALLTLNRGEGGANAIGPELFDGLGLIRTEELRLAGRYYGLDDQYFTTAIDYGYSKTVDEAMRSWDREAVLEDMVRVIRLNRPLIVISRWHGSERDGHGHHQAAGMLTPAAVAAAADPERFPRQISEEGLRPWRVFRVYRGRLLADEPSQAVLNPHGVDPWLGESYQEFGSLGLSLQRSQTAGQRRAGGGAREPARYERLGESAGSPQSGPSLLDGIDTSLAGLPGLFGERVPVIAAQALAEADQAIATASRTFDARRPSAIVAPLVHGLDQVREARRAMQEAGASTPAASTVASETDFVLAIKERQLADAIAAAAGIRVAAHATPQGTGPGTAMGGAVGGQVLDVHVAVEPGPGIGFGSWPGSSLMDSGVQITDLDVGIESRANWLEGPWDVAGDAGGWRGRSTLTIPVQAPPTRPWFYRPDIRHNRYLVRDSADLSLGESRPGAEVRATFAVSAGQDGPRETIDVFAPIRTFDNDAPRGVLERPLEVTPALSVTASPSALILPADGLVTVTASITSNTTDVLDAMVHLDLPAGLQSEPETHHVSLTGADRTATITFTVTLPAEIREADDTPVPLHVVATVGVRAYGEGYRLIEHEDLQPQRLYQDAVVTVYPFRPAIAPGIHVGYVMGVGDDVPAAIEQLGARVTLLGEADLTGGGLDEFDAIVIGTRAYAVRKDLVAANERLLAYARTGGHLVVLYQTPEYRPETQAPYPASLPGNAEEVSEEDAPVAILAPRHPLLTTPNTVTASDFDGWIEQRGSKFFATWSPEYTALLEMHDTDQPPQEGVWLTAPVGTGHFTYVALALQRQLPYGVPGAYRILANLLSLGR
jgi:LmbE family N-acetylglucosaminyl deacetylase